MVNVVLLLVMLGVGLIVVMCLDFKWVQLPLRGERRRRARHAHVGIGKRLCQLNWAVSQGRLSNEP